MARLATARASTSAAGRAGPPEASSSSLCGSIESVLLRVHRFVRNLPHPAGIRPAIQKLELESIPSAGPIRKIIDGLTRPGTGAEYFHALLRELTESLGLGYGFVAEIISEVPLRGRTLAVRALGEEIPNWEFRMGDTPCRELFEAEYCCYPEGVQSCF